MFWLPLFHKKRRFHLLYKQLRNTCIYTLPLTLCLLFIAPAFANNGLFSYFTTDQSNIWNALGGHFELTREADNAEVDRYVREFANAPYYLNELATNAAPYIFYVSEQLQKRDMPAVLALMPMVESDYDPFTYSSRGAVGLWQLMPGTATGFGLRINWWYDGRRDIVASTNVALNFLQYLHDRFHNWLLAIAAYNTGEGTVDAAIRYNKRLGRPTDFWDLPLPYQTRAYVPKILALARIIQNQKTYHVHLKPVVNHAVFSTMELSDPINFSQLAKIAGTNLKTLRKLNPGFRRDQASPNRSYDLLIPIGNTLILANNLLAEEQKKQHQHSVKLKYHRVKMGESLGVLAKRYHTRISAIKESNRLDSNVIHVGEKLFIPTNSTKIVQQDHENNKLNISESNIPGPKEIIYIVKHNDSIASIGRHFGVSSQEIYFWNEFGNKQHIYPGEKITLWVRH